MLEVKNSHSLLDMDQVKIDPTWALRIPGNLAIRRQLLPFTREADNVLVACVDASDQQGIKAIERYVDAPVITYLAEPSSLRRAINRIFIDSVQGTSNQSLPTRTTFPSGEDIDPDGQLIVNLCDEIFHAAIIYQATDIHVEPCVNELRIRFRVDGKLDDYRSVPSRAHGALVSRIKVLSGMDIAERRAPQDGRFTLGNEKSGLIDVRAATIPTKQGERLTLRLLAMNTHELTLEKLGMLESDNQVFELSIAKPNGLVLLTGPTGCGKSTTLYAAIRKLIGQRAINVITIEDPVEYVIDGISQVEVDSADKVSFHKALRSSLRHDPDVLMIGEIRDEVTAEIAIKAALTGHLVFTTLHTNSAVSSVTRLKDMGIEPYLIGAVSRVFVAQRLVRKLCVHCRQPIELQEFEARLLGRPELKGEPVFQAHGCKYCAGMGYVGRTGLFELLPFSSQLSQLVSADARETSINKYLQDQKYPLLVDDAVEKMKLGVTTFEEIAAVVNLI